MIMYIELQQEIVKELLTTDSVSIIGVLLSVIALLIYLYIRTDNKLEAVNTYMRDQDKETLKILGELTSALQDRKEHDRDVKLGVVEIKDTVKDNNTTLASLNAMIQAKILGMN